MNELNYVPTNYEEVKINIDDIKKSVASLQIAIDMIKNSMNTIIPGTACKVVFNCNGIITKTEPLSASDIPDISIDQVIGLKKALEAKTNVPVLKSISKGDTVATGCKVNYDANGFVTGSAPLTEEDIPILPISHIDGLEEVIDNLRSRTVTPYTEHDTVIVPNTACKVSFNKFGHIIDTAKLELTDLPKELITKITQMENIMSGLATKNAVDIVKKVIESKIDANQPIEAGTYVKVTVDSKGLITGGKGLDLSDLPELHIGDIINLRMELNNRVGIDTFNRLQDEFNIYASSINTQKITETIDSAIKDKVNKYEVDNIRSNINDINTRIDSIITNLPSAEIHTEINELKSIISELVGRVSTLESRLIK